jgi:RNA polymerase subunit RPABC4/transcription elongation factor Spt4
LGLGEALLHCGRASGHRTIAVRTVDPERARRHPPRRMEAILGTIGDALGGIFSSPAMQFGIRAIGVYLIILWLATAYWAFRDMQQRSDNAILPYLASAGIILFTPVFFVFGVWVYKIVRPHEKIGEVLERNLAEEALLAEVEAIHHCSTCERRVDDEWIICPTCRTRLNRVCPNCSRLVGLDWSLCAWCGKDFERRPVAAPSLAANLGVLTPTPEMTGRIAASAESRSSAPPPPIRTTVRSASSASDDTRSSSGPPAIRPTVRPPSGSSRGTPPGRPGGSIRAKGSLPASAQDPLPER